MGLQQQFTNTGELWTPHLGFQQSLMQAPAEPTSPLETMDTGSSNQGTDMMALIQAIMSMQQPQAPVDIGAQVQQAVAKGSGVKGSLGTQSFNGIQKGSYY